MALVLSLVCVLVVGGVASPAARHARATGRASAALASLLHSAAISEATYHQEYTAYVAAKSSLGRLSGTRSEELGAVLANVQAMAGAGELTPRGCRRCS